MLQHVFRSDSSLSLNWKFAEVFHYTLESNRQSSIAPLCVYLWSMEKKPEFRTIVTAINKILRIVESSNEQSALMHFPNENKLNCVCESGHYCFKQCLVAPSLPSHYPNRCWHIYNWIFGDNFQSKHECVESVCCKISATFSRPKCANISYGCLAGCLLQLSWIVNGSHGRGDRCANNTLEPCC